MAKRILRGDAPTAKKIQRIKQPLVEGAVTLRIGNKLLEFAGWKASPMATAWNASPHAEFREAIASASGNDLVLTARTAGVPFFVSVTVGNAGPGDGQNETQIITLIHGASGGTWNIAFEGDDADVAWNIDGAGLQTALEGLDTLETGDVSVSGSAGGPWTVTFGGRFAAQNVPPLLVDGTNLTGGDAAAEIVTVQDGDSVGSEVLYNKEATADVEIVWPDANPEATGSVLQSATNQLGRGVNQSHHNVYRFMTTPHTISRGATIVSAGFTCQLQATLSSALDGVVYGEAAANPTFPVSHTDAMSRPLTTANQPFTWLAGSGQRTITGLAAVIQELVNRPEQTTYDIFQLHLRGVSGLAYIAGVHDYAPQPPQLMITFTNALRQIQTVTLIGSHIRGGTVTLSLDAETAAPLEHDATAAEAQTAIAALTNVGAGHVTCSGGPWPATITFSFDSSLGDLPELTAVDDLVNGDVQNSPTRQGGVAVEMIDEQRSRGPNHWDDPLNWQDETGAFGVPQRLDQVYCPDGKTDLLYGTCQRSTFTADAATDRLLIADPQLAFWEGQAVEVRNTGGTLPGGLAADTAYYVRDLDPSGPWLRLATTVDGTPIALTSAGSGVQEIGVRLALFETDARYSGKLGLPRVNKDGKFQEYRTRFLTAWIDDVRIGRGDGSGSQRCQLSTGSRPTSLVQENSQGSSDGAPATQWLGTGTGHVLEILNGQFGVAIDPEQTAEFDTLKQRAGQVLIGRDVTVGDIERTGGTLRMLGATVDGNVTL